MARILGVGGVQSILASVSTVTHEYGYVDTPEEDRTPTQPTDQFTPQRLSDEAVPLTVTEVIFDTLQTGLKWQVIAAAPLFAGVGTFYVDPTKGLIPANTTLQFASSAVTVTEAAPIGSRSLKVSATGNVSLGQAATAKVPSVPSTSPWKVDVLPAELLANGWLQFERHLVVSWVRVCVDWDLVERGPWQLKEEVVTDVRIKTSHRLHGKWLKEG